MFGKPSGPIGRKFQDGRAAQSPMSDEQRTGSPHAGTGNGYGDIPDNSTSKSGYGVVTKTKAEQRRYRIRNVETERRKHGKPARTGAASCCHHHAVGMPATAIGEQYVVAALCRLQYGVCTMTGKDANAAVTHHGKQCVDNLHGILRHREHTLVVLGDQPYACLLKPSVGILMAELLEKPLHKPVPTRVYRLDASDAQERIGEVAASASRDGNFCQGSRTALEDGHLGRWHHTHDVDGGKASRCSGSDDGYVHVR